MTPFSNSSLKVYSKNTIAYFMFLLTHEVDLGADKWEVGLCDLSYLSPNLDTLKAKVVEGETHALKYYTLISRST